MKQVKLKAKVKNADWSTIEFGFGRTQGDLWIAGRGKIQRAMKFKEGDEVEITITKKGC